MKKISTSESLIMEILWNHEEKLSSPQIQELVTQNNPLIYWELVTVVTFLNRLVEKDLVGYDTKGKTRYYYPVIAEKTYRKNLIKDKLKKKLSMSIEELVLAYTGKDIDEESIKKAQDFLNQFEEKE